MRVFETMQACLDTNSLWEAGGLSDQPSWFVDLFKDFAPIYKGFKQRAMWGGDSKAAGQNTQVGKKKTAGVGRQSLGGK